MDREREKKKRKGFQPGLLHLSMGKKKKRGKKSIALQQGEEGPRSSLHYITTKK